MSNIENIPREELIKKEARGINDDDLGEVQQIEQDIIVTRAGVVDKITYRLPKSLADRYDGHNVWFKITKDEAKAQYGIDPRLLSYTPVYFYLYGFLLYTLRKGL